MHPHTNWGCNPFHLSRSTNACISASAHVAHAAPPRKGVSHALAAHAHTHTHARPLTNRARSAWGRIKRAHAYTIMYICIVLEQTYQCALHDVQMKHAPRAQKEVSKSRFTNRVTSVRARNCVPLHIHIYIYVHVCTRGVVQFKFLQANERAHFISSKSLP